MVCAETRRMIPILGGCDLRWRRNNGAKSSKNNYAWVFPSCLRNKNTLWRHKRQKQVQAQMGTKKKSPCPTLLCLLVNAKLLLCDTTIATLTTKANLHSLKTFQCGEWSMFQCWSRKDNVSDWLLPTSWQLASSKAIPKLLSDVLCRLDT
jgi:hypothetical protein